VVKKAGELLKTFLSGDQFERAMKFDEFHRNWPDIAGQRLAAHSSVFDIDKGIMIVRADHPGWIQLLQLRQAYILKTIQTSFPELGIRGIAFRLVDTEAYPAVTEKEEVPEGTGSEKAPSNVSPHSESDLRTETEGPGGLENIEDPRLRDVLIRLRKSISDRNG
jgi:hypothetical protein